MSEKFEDGTISRHFRFEFEENKETHDYRNVIFFVNAILSFQNVFFLHENENQFEDRFSKSSVFGGGGGGVEILKLKLKVNAGLVGHLGRMQASPYYTLTKLPLFS